MSPALTKHAELVEYYNDLAKREALQAIKCAAAEIEAHKGTAAPSWLPASQVPEDDQLCLVLDNNGALFLLTPCGGKWMKRVAWWLPIPPRPDTK